MAAAAATTGEAVLHTVRCSPPSGAYDIVVGRGLLPRVVADLASAPASGLPRSSSVVVVTDANVWRLHGADWVAAAAGAGALPRWFVYVLPPGEGAKCREVKADVEDWMLAAGVGRDGVVVGWGGGVVTDLAGFVAATYMRGVPVIHLPTTLLAMVDAAVGGKTGVDTPAGKNLVGAFHHPARVYADVAALATLPNREVANGLAEVVKAGVIASPALFDACDSPAVVALVASGRLPARGRAPPPPPLPNVTFARGASSDGDSNGTSASGGDATTPAGAWTGASWEALVRLVADAIAVKAAVVAGDEREGGARAILNFGHTVGHALEAALAPGWLHGEAVAVGMVVEAAAGAAMGITPPALPAILRRVLAGVGLPTRPPRAVAASDAGLSSVLRYMAVDKKNSRDARGDVCVKCVLLSRLGAVASPPWTHAVPVPLLTRLLSAGVTIAGAAPLSPTPAAPAVVAVPGSKSLSNRALLLAALASGTSHLRGLLASDDTAVMVAALQAMGARIVMAANGIDAMVTGCGGVLTPPATPVWVHNAGTASRFLTAVMAVLPPHAAPVTLHGNDRMHERPIAPLVDALRRQGADIQYGGTPGCLPLRFVSSIPGPPPAGTAVATTGSRRHRVVNLAACLSSQYVSAILMAAPLFPTLGGSADDDSSDDDGTVEVVLEEETPTSLPYILMTCAAMAAFGIHVLQPPGTLNRFIVPRGRYTPPAGGGVYVVEGDASSASYPAALAALTGRTVTLPAVGAASTQGDAAFPRLLAAWGASLTQGAGDTTVGGFQRGAPCIPPGVPVDMRDMTDTFMTACVVAALGAGTIRIVGVSNQRVKECNRLAVMACELTKCGVDARETADGIDIDGTGPSWERLLRTPVTIACHDDHRIAMSFGVLGAAAAVLKPSTAGRLTLDDAFCVDKTYPAFWDDLVAAFGVRLTGTPGGPVADEGVLDLAPGAAAHTVVFIGMRGAGKSTLAARAAALLAARGDAATAVHLVDLDRALEAAVGAERHAAACGTCGAPACGAHAPVPVSVADVVAAEGWPGFRAREAACLVGTLRRAATTAGWHVVATGGGAVETPACRAALSAVVAAGGRVIEVQRPIADIVADLAAASGGHGGGHDAGRPAYAGGASLEEVACRRAPLYAAAATHVFPVLAGDTDWDGGVLPEFDAWLARLLGGLGTAPPAARCPDAARMLPSPPFPLGAAGWRSDGSHFLCLAVRDVCELGTDGGSGDVVARVADVLRAAAVDHGAAAVELRVDCLATSDVASLGQQVALLRRALRRAVAAGVGGGVPPRGLVLAADAPPPLIWTVRSVDEGGRGPARDTPAYTDLVAAGVRFGVECVDVESGRRADAAAVRTTLAGVAPAPCHAVGTTCIASAHWPRGVPSAAALVTAVDIIVEGTADARLPCALVKLVGAAPDGASGVPLAWPAALCAARCRLAARLPHCPLLALLMGPGGVATRPAAEWLAPVTHPALPAPAAPGQLDAATLAARRVEAGFVTPRAYALFGTPIAASPSPAMHTAAFAARGLPHTYTRVDTADAATVLAVLRGAGPDGSVWAGGNVTVPLKEAVAGLCDALSPAAAAIGAVNTLRVAPPRDDGGGGRDGHDGGCCHVYGDNTDWVGIARPLAARQLRARTALVVGAGGTAAAALYAAHALGLAPYVVNPRTPVRAAALVHRLGVGVAIVGDDARLHAPTALPGGAAVIGAIICTLPPAAGWLPPRWLLAQRPVVLDVAYRPRASPLLVAAAAAGCAVIEGVEMLIEQAASAFAVWTGGGCDAPRLRRPGAAPAACLNDDVRDSVPLAALAAAAYAALEAP